MMTQIQTAFGLFTNIPSSFLLFKSSYAQQCNEKKKFLSSSILVFIEYCNNVKK